MDWQSPQYVFGSVPEVLKPGSPIRVYLMSDIPYISEAIAKRGTTGSCLSDHWVGGRSVMAIF